MILKNIPCKHKYIGVLVPLPKKTEALFSELKNRMLPGEKKIMSAYVPRKKCTPDKGQIIAKFANVNSSIAHP